MLKILNVYSFDIQANAALALANIAAGLGSSLSGNATMSKAIIKSGAVEALIDCVKINEKKLFLNPFWQYIREKAFAKKSHRK